MKAKNDRLVLLVLTAALGFAGPVAAQKSGGVLRIQHMDTPPSASIHEEATVSVAVPFMSLYNNLVMFDQHVPKNSLESVVPDLATKWEWKDGNTKLVFTAARGREVARRPAVQRQGRRLHLRPAAGRREREQAPAQSALVVVDQRREGHRRQRHPGHVPSQGAAALAAGAARLGLHADLSLPRAARPDAAPAGRHRPVQARRVQDERGHQAGEEPRLLEEGPALSRRHRVHHHARPRRPACWRSSPASST